MDSKVPFRFFITHPKVVVLEWEDAPDKRLLNRLSAFKKVLLKEFKELCQITEGYCSLMLFHTKNVQEMSNYPSRLYALYDLNVKIQSTGGKLWQIPVCYEDEMAPDLNSLANRLKLKPETLIGLHTSQNYLVHFVGFLPGFLYLSGLPNSLEYPRKKEPRASVAPGSVGIGGKQTGIYPMASPGGWHLIGRTPYPLFNPKKKKPCFAKAGDSVQFLPISKSEFVKIESQIKDNSLQIKPL
jgi:inhibitor of KinA